MRKIVPFILALFCALGVGAETLVFEAPFQGVSTDPCRDTTLPSTIFCSDGTVDGSGNLLDLSGENLIPYSDQVDNWSGAVNVTVTSDAMRDPDNLYRADIINEGNAVGTNFRVSIINLMAAGTKYTSTFALKPLNRSWVMIGWETLSIYAYVDLKNKIVGNTVGSPTVELRDLPGGWVEVSLTNVALNNGGIYLFVAEANGDNTFDGLSQPSIAIARATLYKREGQWATKRSPYIRTSGVAKPRHDLTVAPAGNDIKVSDLPYDTSGVIDWTDLGLASPSFEVDFSQDPSGAAITANTGQVLTKAGAPTRVTDGTWPAGLAGAEGYAHTFDGAADYYTSTIGPPAGSFSVACVVTPVTLPAQGMFIANYTTAGNLRGWGLYTSNTGSVQLSISDDGSSVAGHFSVIQKPSILATHRTSVVVATYYYNGDGSSTGALYVDESSAVTSTTMNGPVFAGSSNLTVGAAGDPVAYTNSLLHHCVVADGVVWTEAQARNIIRAYKGTLVRVDGALAATTSSSATYPDLIMADPSVSTTEPFIIPQAAGSPFIGSPASGEGGLYSPSAHTNLWGSANEPSAETWVVDAGCGQCPTNWQCSCTAGDGTAAIAPDTTHKANRTTSAKFSLTGTTSVVYATSPCITTGVGTDVYMDTWAFKAGAGASSFKLRVYQYDTGTCTSYLATADPYTGSLAAGWTHVQGLMPAASWNAATSSYYAVLYEDGNGGVDVSLDAIQVRQASTATDAFCMGTCAVNVNSVPTLFSANGESWIELTQRTPWAGTDLVGSSAFTFADGTGSGSSNHIGLSISVSTREPWFQIYDASTTIKYILPNVSNWVANTSYSPRAYFSGLGDMGMMWPSTAWYTTTSGTGTGTRGATQPTTYIGGTSLGGADSWTRNVHITSRNKPMETAATGQLVTNNRPLGRKFYGAETWYTKASHDSMKIFDVDHTITFLDHYNSVGGSRSSWSNGSTAGGAYSITETTRRRCNYGTGSTSVSVYGPTVDPTYDAVQQCVRSGNTATMYSNGVGGTPIDVTGAGIDAAIAFYVGRYFNSGYEYLGNVYFLRIDAEALSTDDLNYERQLLEGWAQSKKKKYWTFSRSTTGYGSHFVQELAQIAANKPRVNLGGVLIEPQATQLLRYSQAFDSWATKTRLSVVPNVPVYPTPDGTYTADVLHEDNTPASTHAIYDYTATVTNGAYYTCSAYVRPLNRTWVMVSQFSTDYKSCYFDVQSGKSGSCSVGASASIERAPNGFFRVSTTRAANGTSNACIIYIAEADSDHTFDGLDQDSLVVWGAQLEAGKYPSSYIYAGSSPNVIRITDAMYMSASDTGLPLTVCPTCTAKKFHMSMDVKCPYSTISTPGENRYIFTVGGAASANNQVQFYISSSGRLYSQFVDNAAVSHSGYSAVDAVSLSDWVNLDLSFDTTDLTSYTYKINGSSAGMTYTNNTGTGTLDLTGLNVQFGSRIAGQVDGCYHRNLKLYVE